MLGETRSDRHAGAPSGTMSATAIAGVGYHRQFLAPDQADRLHAALMAAVPWQQEWLHLYGRRVRVPRLVAWCGEAGVNYRYSGSDHACDGWLAGLDAVRRRLADEVGLVSNFVLINRYPDGQAYMGWHTDDERAMAGPVGSVSLGAPRRFLLRPAAQRPSRGLELEHGSLLIMDGRIRHSLPRTRRPVGERINLTFRRIVPEA